MNAFSAACAVSLSIQPGEQITSANDQVRWYKSFESKAIQDLFTFTISWYCKMVVNDQLGQEQRTLYQFIELF